MTLLIGIDEIKEYRSISRNVDVSKQLEPYILDAQEFDLRPFLGEDFYIALLEDFEASPSLALYSDLFNGVTYTYSGHTYKHEGIKAMLVHYAHARYLKDSGVHATKTGFVAKKNDLGEAISEKTMARIIGQSMSKAVIYQERVKLYLDFNYTSYPLWRYGGVRRRKGQITITSVGGNSGRGIQGKTSYNGNCDPEIIQ